MATVPTDPNFRLPTDIRPLEYRAHVTLQHEQRSFQGTLALTLTRKAAGPELLLHAVDLEIREARYKAQGKVLQCTEVKRFQESETVQLRFSEALPAGEGVLELEWSGRYTRGLRGLYLAGNVAVTQFEAADARRLFPCFDEPLFKARWALQITAPAGLKVLANGKLLKEEAREGWTTHTFETTEVLSSYLVALACGDFVEGAKGTAAGIPVRTFSSKEKVALTAYGQDVAVQVLPRLQEYFGLPYAFGKVDQIALSDFEAGAMENVGLITYRETALLSDPATASLASAKRIAEVVTHELAHQWFGNWVTMVWWDDLWLNEAFATWMAYKIVAPWRPEWRIWLDFNVGTASALNLDALQSTHPVRSEVRNAREATEAFDLITYEKGGAVLRMIEAFLGEETFREGIRAYMKTFGRGNAVADDLWNALGKASKQPVLELANAWIRKGGHPLISVEQTPEGIGLRQERFYLERGRSSDELWPVPVVLRFEDDAGVHTERVLFSDRTQKVPLKLRGSLRWLVANASSTGFYRVAYDASLLKLLNGSLASLETSERVSLLQDEWALVRTGRREIGAFLELLSKFGAETDYAVLDELVGRLGALRYRLVGAQDLPKFDAFVQKLLGHQLPQVGWDSPAGEVQDAKLRRASILRGLGVVARSREVLEGGRDRMLRVLGGDKAALEPNLHDPVLTTIARPGDAALFDTVRAAYQSETDPSYRRRYLQALSAFEQPDLWGRAHDLFFTGELKTQDYPFFIHGLLMNPAGSERAWSRLQAEWATVAGRLENAPSILRHIVESFGNLKERKHLEQVTAFFKAHPLEEVQQATKQTLERLTQDVELRERLMPGVAAWLNR